MATLSLRQIVQDTFGTTDLSGGFRQTLFANLYLQPSTARFFPFISDASSGTETYQSVFRTLTHWDTWPESSDFVRDPDYPSNGGTPYSEDIQGVSHTQDYWIFSQRDRSVLFWPVTVDLESSTAVFYRSKPTNGELDPGYDHYGDCGAKYYPSIDSWFVAVAVEGSGLPNKFVFHEFQEPTPSRAAREDYVGSWSIPINAPQYEKGTDCPWVTFHKTHNLLVSSIFGNPGKPPADRFFFYELSNELGASGFQPPSISYVGDIRWLNRMGAPFSISEVQGGDISNHGRVFISVKADVQSGGGVYGFDLVTGRHMLYLPRGGGSTFFGENEGLTVWDVSSLSAPNVSGCIHLTLLDNEGIGEDDIDFTHWSTNALVRSTL